MAPKKKVASAGSTTPHKKARSTAAGSAKSRKRALSTAAPSAAGRSNAKAPRIVQPESETVAQEDDRRTAVVAKVGQILECDPCGASSKECLGLASHTLGVPPRSPLPPTPSTSTKYGIVELYRWLLSVGFLVLSCRGRRLKTSRELSVSHPGVAPYCLPPPHHFHMLALVMPM